MKRIELFDLEDECLDNIAIVDSPAIESNFLCFAKARKFSFADSEKHNITGAVLIPDMNILRYDDNGEPFYVYFSANTVESIAHKFMSNFKNKAFNLEHLQNTDKLTLIESWIKTSEEDKSNALGIDCPIGTWFITCHIEDEDIWQSCKNGVYHGFSIAGNFVFADNEENQIVEEVENFLKENQE